MANLTFALLALVLTNPALASILPPNNLAEEDVPGFTRSEISEAQFNQVLDTLEKVYSPIVAEHGATLVISRLWSDRTVNASAIKYGNEWHILMYGGFARRPEITADAFMLTACHELGHHLGGKPIYRRHKDMSVEGQADYFAVHACAKLVWGQDYEQNATFRLSATEEVLSICDGIYTTTEDQDLCYRTITASESIAHMLDDLYYTQVAISTPSTDIAGITHQQHPSPQCRLDTMVSGSLCPVPFDDYQIPSTWQEVRSTSCLQNDDFTFGTRPVCWFKPPEADDL
jgi:hypothetical protein